MERGTDGLDKVSELGSRCYGAKRDALVLEDRLADAAVDAVKAGRSKASVAKSARVSRSVLNTWLRNAQKEEEGVWNEPFGRPRC